MTVSSKLALSLSLPAIMVASCSNAETGDSADTRSSAGDFSVETMGVFEEPWAIEFAPGTGVMFITEKAGVLKIMDTSTGEIGTVSGAPEVAYGGQGGLGDIAFLPSEADQELTGRTIYLSWAEMGDGETRGAALGRGTLSCDATDLCAIEGLEVIWRQSPKVTGRGHYSHRILVSPDEQYLFIASGDRQKQDPAQDKTNTLGTMVRLNLDGTPAEGNPFADESGVPDEIWSYGHRNILGMDWDAEGRLWEVEHGPAGGDELNLVERAANYGWPTRSNGDNYNGVDIPDHTEDDGFTKPAMHWTPVIAPGDMIIYSGDMFAPWKGNALIAGLKSEAVVRVAIDGSNGTASEEERLEVGGRLRSIEQGPDGAIWVAEDGDAGRLLKLTM
ncbi:PQQ-dependent sugar dehydrogenase [Erythrobacter sp. YT30]|uniref:PQQ-dependent sugar dehydrogenase n=1 Tax=Erythrobacter sp. YT30 TaxID=1735012 RepID=UPI00076C61B0|nr:PQQ-dependent sugar dehydrogenase [Erythrobacter sp. YT30]KWV90491.1 dehydrogenase [Erythrobacter sp. YT30]